MVAPKVTWGIVMVVIGIIMIFKGFSASHDANFCMKEMRLLDSQLANFSDNNKVFNTINYKIMEQEKTNGILIALIGMTITISGTLLMTEKKVSYELPPEDDPDKKNDKWKF